MIAKILAIWKHFGEFKASTVCFVSESTQIDTIGGSGSARPETMEENNNFEEIDRDFEYKIKLLEKKFKKANKPKDVKKALDEFEKLSEDFVEKQKCLKNYETLEDFFERKVR